MPLDRNLADSNSPRSIVIEGGLRSASACHLPAAANLYQGVCPGPSGANKMDSPTHGHKVDVEAFRLIPASGCRPSARNWRLLLSQDWNHLRLVVAQHH